MRLYNTLTAAEETVRARSRQHRPDVHLRPHGLRARPHRQLPHVHLRGRPAPDAEALLGYRVTQVMNFTDVDDRTIAGAQKAGMDLRAYTDQYIDAFREDARALGSSRSRRRRARPTKRTSARWRSMIAALESNGHTYRSDGSIYFKISTLPGYGRLARLDHDGMKPGARVDTDNYAKEDARDFVLWKGHRDGEPTWESRHRIPPGRPGWHHRVLGDGAAAAGRAADRHPRRRHRPDLPAPRERDRAERGRDAASRSRASGCTSST